jgi:hypothetical protein
MSRQHTLKILPEYFEAVLQGRKTFEVRNNDRDYKESDMVLLMEFDGKETGYTGRSKLFMIGYILEKYPVLEKDFVVFSLLPV